ncbi:putative ABC transporter ATP-binding protein YxlF [Enhygromyxa salina]|uniref:Putative ABC transporter ATP-binding protein YxlF n=1 Tax=Enhygromyxa salina TaxID=215803 RepID=A0A2S9XD85_9BACT|nr:ATP-binding cassette domain-containing protein [Enhygromyxa salina]PRP90826.1 putative ABC transporter ATP-binding protein YxlF [Enhygromyxa salina]
MSARPPASLEVSNLTFYYPGSEDPALRSVDFRVAPGERVGLLGPNGAGKSTLMRICCGYLPVPRARDTLVRVADLSLVSDSLAVRELVGYLPEQVPLYQELRVREHLEFRATVKRIRRRARAAEIERVIELSGLEGMAETPIAKLSRGYRQRVGIADALLGSPPLVVLDEPTVGLDPNQVQGIRSMLKNLGGNQTLIFSSHILAEVEALCDRVIILSRGQVVADETVAKALATDTLFVEWDGADGEAIRACVEAAWSALGREDPVKLEISLSRAGGARKTVDRSEDSVLRAAVTSGGVSMDDLAAAIGRASLDAGMPLIRLEPGRRRLEERFAVVTGFRDDSQPGGTA